MKRLEVCFIPFSLNLDLMKDWDALILFNSIDAEFENHYLPSNQQPLGFVKN